MSSRIAQSFPPGIQQQWNDPKCCENSGRKIFRFRRRYRARHLISLDHLIWLKCASSANSICQLNWLKIIRYDGNGLLCLQKRPHDNTLKQHTTAAFATFTPILDRQVAVVLLRRKACIAAAGGQLENVLLYVPHNFSMESVCHWSLLKLFPKQPQQSPYLESQIKR